MIWILVLTFLVIYIVRFYWRVSKLPKGPFPLPLIGNMHQVKPDELHFAVDDWSKKYGDIFTMWFMEKPVVAITDYELIKEALITKGDILADRTGEYPEELFMTVENGGVIFSSGENWREQRRASLHILRDFGVGKNIMETIIHDQITSFIDHIEKTADKNAVDFRWSIHVMIANVINTLLYGYSYPQDNCDRLMAYTNKLDSLFSEMFATMWPVLAMMFPKVKYIPYVGWKAYGEHAQRYNYCIDFVREDVKNALKDYSREFEPNCYVQAYYQRMEGNEFLDEDNMLNNCCDFFFAGMETTSVTLRWTVLYLANNQSIQDLMRAEIIRDIGFDQLPKLADRNRLPYTNAVLYEIQRHANIFSTSLQHKAREDVTIGGIRFPKGTNFMPSLRNILYDERIFEKPLEFNPERFMNPHGKTLNQDLVNKVVPFGLGKRVCAGEGLAKNELFLASAAIVQKYRLLPPKDGKVDMKQNYGTVTYPNTNLLRIENIDPKTYKF